MSWKIIGVGVHSNIRRVLDGHTADAIRQGANPDTYVALVAAAAAIAQHVGHHLGGVEVTLTGHGNEVGVVEVKAWDVKGAAKLYDEQVARDDAARIAQIRDAEPRGEPKAPIV
jgi:hypothetical protein